MDKKEWIDKIDDKFLFKYLKEKDDLKKIPNKIKKNIIFQIRNNEYSRSSKKNEIKPFFNFKYTFACIVLILIPAVILFFYLSIKNNLDFKKTPSLLVKNYNGNISIIKNEKKKDLPFNKKIHANEFIKTEKDSNATIIIGDKSIIKLGELTEIKIIRNEFNNNNEINEIFLSIGLIDCDVTLPTKDSIFKIYTDIVNFLVIGTKFSIKIFENNIELNVKEGKVEILNILKYPETNLEDIKESNDDIYLLLSDILNKKIYVNNKIIFNKDELNKINNNFNESIDELKEIIKNKKITDKEKKEFINKIKSIDNEYEKITETNKTTSDKKEKTDKEISTIIKIKNQKLIKNDQFNNFIFIYNWSENPDLDQNIENLKMNISRKINGLNVFSISPENIDLYHNRVGNIVFFILQEDIIKNKLIKTEKYLPISIKDLSIIIENENNAFITKVVNNKNIIVFCGKTKKELINVIDYNKDKIFD